MKEFFIKTSTKINKNLFTIILYYCTVMLLLSSLFDYLTGKSIEYIKDHIIERVVIGIVVGFLHRFIFNKKVI